MLIFENSVKCSAICSALSNPAKRRILEILSRGPLTLDALATLAGISEIFIRDVVNEMESLGLMRTETVDKEGVKKVFIKPLLQLYYEGDISGLDKIVEEVSRGMFECFMKVIGERADEVEKAFNDNEGRYTVSSILAYCFAVAYKKACEELQSIWEEEYRDVVGAWIEELTKTRSKDR